MASRSATGHAREWRARNRRYARRSHRRSRSLLAPDPQAATTALVDRRAPSQRTTHRCSDGEHTGPLPPCADRARCAFRRRGLRFSWHEPLGLVADAGPARPLLTCEQLKKRALTERLDALVHFIGLT